MRTLLWHAEGEVPVGRPIAIVGVAAEHRRDALAAVDAMLVRLKGVAKRTDLEREPR
ncbi:MAG: molybdenum cofactor biosynthesis protein MoaE [Candidatus Thermoplasmatota archaeon]